VSAERKYGIDSGWIVSTTDECTCGMGRYSEYGHESFCGIEQEAPVEEFDGWVKHMQKQAEQRGMEAEGKKWSVPSMYDEGRWAERKRVVEIITDYYKVAPKAAEPLLSRIDIKGAGA
jgi:hypothetical protein